MKSKLLFCLNLILVTALCITQVCFSDTVSEEVAVNDPVWDQALELWLQTDGKLNTRAGQNLCTNVGSQSQIRLKIHLPDDRTNTFSQVAIPYAAETCSAETPDSCTRDGAFPYVQDDLYLATPAMMNGYQSQEITSHQSHGVIYRTVQTSAEAYSRVCLENQTTVTAVPSWFEMGGVFTGKLMALWLAGKLTSDQLVDFKNGLFSEAVQQYGMLEAHISFASDAVKLLQTQLGFSPMISNCLVTAMYGLGYLLNHGSVNTIEMTQLNFKNSANFFWPSAMVGTGVECADISIVTPYISEWFEQSTGSQQAEMSALVSEIFKGPFLLGTLITSEGFFHPNSISALLSKMRIKSSINTKKLINKYARKHYTDRRGMEFLVDFAGAMAFDSAVEYSGVGGASTDIFIGEYYRQMGYEQFHWQSSIPDGAGYLHTAGNILLTMLLWQALEGVVDFTKRAKLIPALTGSISSYTPMVVNNMAKTIWGEYLGSAAHTINIWSQQLHQLVPYSVPSPIVVPKGSWGVNMAPIPKSFLPNAITNLIKGGAMYVGMNHFGQYVAKPVSMFNRFVVQNYPRGSYARSAFQSGVMYTINFSVTGH